MRLSMNEWEKNKWPHALVGTKNWDNHPLGHEFCENDYIMFELSGIGNTIFLFRVSMKWGCFIQTWNRLERDFAIYNYGKRALKASLRIICLSILTLALLEHSMVNLYKLKTSYETHSGADEIYEHYFVTSYTHIFNVIPYHPLLGILMQFFNLQQTFCWNFCDVFIILISTALATRLKQLTKRVEIAARFKVADVLIWKRLREDYDRLSKLCMQTNEILSWIIVLSFTVNLYFVIVQLFSVLRPITNELEKAYFYISLSLLVLRIICVCMFGGRVFEQSQEMVPLLQSVPSHVYNEEIERLLHTLACSEIVIHGCYFFRITRGLILKMAGAIVTYELVLVQFKNVLLKQ